MSRVCIHEIEYEEESRNVLSGTWKYLYKYYSISEETRESDVHPRAFFYNLRPAPGIFL